ncbi:MAG TPA: FtsX-like permease family protein [Pinirhizobacter sp.]|uniref:ABC transporter permease n=1 Tax=Pinirhizobacter sp. TaxID=2950432 RepID=UPI002CA2B345|nr:FtsX-like permease family protein [Pinirhizobacter sp.]HMH67770.1 FtsX-like permease family protein [Pinirhizobacter sp.]
MQIAPILAALKKHRMATFLIAMEIALACAVLCNALYLVTERVRLSHVQSGVDEDRLVAITLDGVTDDQAADLAPRLRQRLAQLPGVESVSVANATPFGPQAGEMGFRIDPNDPVFHLQGHFYLGDANFAKTLGLRLVSGRWFTLDDYAHVDGFLPKTSVVLVDADYAAKLWPGQDPLGKVVLSGNQTLRVVGLLARLVRPNPSPFATTNAFLMPTLPGTGLASVYLLRTVPGHAEEVFRRATAAISRDERGVIINAQASGPLVTLRDAYFANTRSMAMMMVGVIAALLLVSALGIVGLASFWVQQRRQQIGIRRAIGATRRDILHYFQLENFLIVGGGIVVGMVLAYVLSAVLMKQYELPLLPAYYLPYGALILWLLGQLAVLGPARRAAAVPPVVATRNI